MLSPSVYAHHTSQYCDDDDDDEYVESPYAQPTAAVRNQLVAKLQRSNSIRGAIHQFLRIILKLRILVLLAVSTLSYVVEVKNHS
jgi:hypothetical protein